MGRSLIACFTLLCSLIPSFSFASFAHAGTLVQIPPQGFIPTAQREQMFTLVPNVPARPIVLTLSFESSVNPSLIGGIGFYVLSEEGVRQIQVGVPIAQAALTSGNLMTGQGEYRLQTEFLAQNSQTFTIIVYNNASNTVFYHLRAVNGTFLSSQEISKSGLVVPTPVPPVIVPTVPPLIPTPIPPPLPLPTPVPTSFKTISFSLQAGEKRYFQINPTREDARVTVRMRFSPGSLYRDGQKVNMFLLDESRMNRLNSGEKLEMVNIAAGNYLPNKKDGVVELRVKAVGFDPFTLIVINRSQGDVKYTLVATGGRFQP